VNSKLALSCTRVIYYRQVQEGYNNRGPERISLGETGPEFATRDSTECMLIRSDDPVESEENSSFTEIFNQKGSDSCAS
jgi:hypothetical protein